MSTNLLTPTPETPKAPTPVLGRQCGECALCCKLPGIPELNKPAGQWCIHCTSHRSCGNYENRPQTCRNFFCLYMLDPNLGEEWFPTKARMHLSITGEEGNLQLIVMVDNSRPDAWRKEPYYSKLKQCAETLYVIVTIGRRKIMVFPDHDKDLGDAQDGDIIEFIGEPQADGSLRKTARVRRATAS